MFGLAVVALSGIMGGGGVEYPGGDLCLSCVGGFGIAFLLGGGV